MKSISCILLRMKSLRVARVALSLAAAAAVATLVAVVVRGPIATGGPRVALDPFGNATIGLSANLLSAVLLVLITSIAAVVAVYAQRNLTGQARPARFAALECTVVFGLSLVVLASSLPLLAVGWTTAGLAMSALVAHASTPRARAAARSVRNRLMLGDFLLWTAVAVCGLLLGTLNVDALAQATAGATTIELALVATLFVLAGAVRSALVPAHRWLPEVAEGPSPVSALLHAGFVNGIGILSLLLWPLVVASPTARATALVLGVLTALLATAQHRVRSDVKGRLASSTSSQMGYLAITVALGIPAAVLVHLIGHGLWKAGLFLGAGGAVTRVRSSGHVSVHPKSARSFMAAALGALTVLAAATVSGPWGDSLLTMPGYLVPVTVALTAASVGAYAAVTRSRGNAVSAFAVVVAASALYVLAVRAAEHVLSDLPGWIPPTWGQPGATVVAVVSLLLILVGVCAWRLDASIRRGGYPRLVAAVARTTMAPSPVVRRISLTSPQPEAKVAAPEVSSMAAALAAQSVSPLWPLHAFVASNPIAGFEGLPFVDATRAAATAWGSRPGIDAHLLRLAVRDGAVSDDILLTIAESVVPGPDVALQGLVRQRAELVRALLLADDAPAPDVEVVRRAIGSSGLVSETFSALKSPAELVVAHSPSLASLDARARDVVSTYASRAYGAPAWPADTRSVWMALRADAASLDRRLGTRGASDLIARLSASADEALADLTQDLGLADTHLVTAFTRVLTRDPGWVAHLAWRQRLGLATGNEEILDLLVSRLAMEAVVVAAGGAPPKQDESQQRDLAPMVATMLAAVGCDALSVGDEAWASLHEIAATVGDVGLDTLRLRAWEESYRRPVLDSLGQRAAQLRDSRPEPTIEAPHSPPASAQLVMCIDVRSERLRRHLEAAGPWETFGAAGFFGIGLSHCSPSGHVSERLPALLRPEYEITELPATGQNRQWLSSDLAESVHCIESQIATPFAFAEAAGWVTGPTAMVHTFSPRWSSAILSRVGKRLRLPAQGTLVIERGSHAPSGFDLTHLVDAAEGFLRTTGLLEPSPVVLLVGHGGSAANNPHVAAYDCGACGGQAGDVSARVMAQVLNDARVREELRERGISIADETWFGAALHDTTRDRVDILSEVPPCRRATVDELTRDLSRACDAVALERAELLPGGMPVELRGLRRVLDGRAVDWAQVRPEWGLAGNAAIVIGPRSLTSGLDLDGRVFLQSYRPDLDLDGSALDFLLGAPLVVAQWISMQYWCSTVDPEVFGAGDKTTHNVIAPYAGEPAPLTGVLTGVRGDLRIGLPWQAVSSIAPDGSRWSQRPFHEPLRLLAVVYAEPQAVESVIMRRPEVSRLVTGEWIDLVVIEPDSGRLLRWHQGGEWVEVDGADLNDLEQPDYVAATLTKRESVLGHD